MVQADEQNGNAAGEAMSNPLSPARDEENRRLAEFLGFVPYLDGYVFHKCGSQRPNFFTECDAAGCLLVNPDFRTDEAANALLLEDMPYAVLSHRRNGWVCYWNSNPAEDPSRDPDRKTAVVKAYIAYREAQK